MANIFGIINDFSKATGAKIRDTMGASQGIAGPDNEANSGLRDPKPYRTYTNDGLFEGYDGSIWQYFKLPEDVQVEWTRTPKESADNQAFLLELIDKVGDSLNVTESTRKDERRKFHISLVEEVTSEIKGYDGMSPAHADYLRRMSCFRRPQWYGYIGFQMKLGSIRYGVYGWKEQITNYLELMSNNDKLRAKLLQEDLDRIRTIASDYQLRPLNFAANRQDFELLTAWFGESDDVYGKPREVVSSRLRIPEHGDSIFTPQWGEIMFHAIKPREEDGMFLSDPLNDGQVRFGNAVLAPSANTVHVNIRGEIRSSKAAFNIFENKMSNALVKRDSLERKYRSGDGMNFSADREAKTRISDAQYAMEMASLGHAMLDNVEIIVANKVTGRKQIINEYLAPYNLQAVPITARQEVALGSTIPGYPDSVFRVPSSNIKRNPNTLNMYGGVLSMSGLFRSTKPCGPGGILIGLSDAGYEFKEIYTEIDAAYKYSGQPVIMVTGTTGSGKAMPLTQGIRRFDGSITTFGDVTVGDKLIDMGGYPTTVTSLSPIEYNKQLFAMELSDGRTNTSDAQHQWLVIDETSRKHWEDMTSIPHIRSTVKHINEARKKLHATASRVAMVDRKGLEEFLSATIPEVYQLMVTTPFFWDMTSLDTPSQQVTEFEGSNIFMKRVNEVMHHGYYMMRSMANGGVDQPLMLRRTTKELYAMMQRGEKFYLPDARASRCENILEDHSRDMHWENYQENKNIPQWVFAAHHHVRLGIIERMLTYPCVTISSSTKTKIVARVSDTAVTQDLILMLRSCGVTTQVSKRGAELHIYPHWNIGRSLKDVRTISAFANRRMGYTEIKKITSVETEPVRCISVDSPTKTFLLDDYTVTSNTQQMLQMAAQVRYMGRGVFFLNPKQGDTSLKSFFDLIGGITINMSNKYLEDNPGLMDPMFFLKDRKDVGKLLADMIINAMSMTDTSDRMEATKIMAKMQSELIERAQMPHNQCSWDIIMGNRRYGTPKLSSDEILNFVHDKMKVSAFWRASISQNAEVNEELRRQIFSGRPVLIEWGNGLHMPTHNDSSKWTPDHIDAMQSVSNVFRFASEVIGTDRRGGALFIDESHILQHSSEAMHIVRKSGKEWRQANVRLVLATQELKEFMGDNSNNISTSIGAYIIMQVAMNDAEEERIFYEITGLPKSPKYSEYIANAGVKKAVGNKSYKPIPNGIYVDKIYDYMSGFLAGPWPKAELSAGLTDKEGEEARKRVMEAATSGSLFNATFGDPDDEFEAASRDILQENQAAKDV